MRRVVLVLALLSGCGGSPKADEGPQKGGGAITDDPAHRCLGRAQAVREKKANEPAKITLKHVLVKYAGAKNAADSITRTKEQACLRALEALDKLKAGTEWDAVVGSYSDEAGAGTRAGLVGEVSRSELAPPVADAAFDLGAGEVSDVVESAFGIHVLMRTQ